jgi:hypothetical protein
MEVQRELAGVPKALLRLDPKSLLGLPSFANRFAT